MASQAVASVMQLSTSATMKSIPREQSYSDFPVTVRVKAPPEMMQPPPVPADIVVVMDISGSMESLIDLEADAVARVMNKFSNDRLAAVVFEESTRATELKAMTDEQRQALYAKLKKETAMGATNITDALLRAADILNNQKGRRPALVILFSDGRDTNLINAPENWRLVPAAYPVHAFGVSVDPDATVLGKIADRTHGSYTRLDPELRELDEKLEQLWRSLSVAAVDMRICIRLRTLHPGVSLLRIVDEAAAGDLHTSSTKKTTTIGDDRQSAEILVVKETAPELLSFTVYLYLPEGPGSGADGAMDLLSVGGSYWGADQKQAELRESVVTIARPPAGSGCKEHLDRIEDRLRYWCKVKQQKTKAAAAAVGNAGESCRRRCQLAMTEALGDAALEATNTAMHRDIYMTVLHAIKLRQSGGKDGAAAATEI